MLEEQITDIIDMHDALGRTSQLIFELDNSSGHGYMKGDALIARKMSSKFGGKQSHLRNSVVTEVGPQSTIVKTRGPITKEPVDIDIGLRPGDCQNFDYREDHLPPACAPFTPKQDTPRATASFKKKKRKVVTNADDDATQQQSQQEERYQTSQEILQEMVAGGRLTQAEMLQRMQVVEKANIEERFAEEFIQLTMESGLVHEQCEEDDESVEVEENFEEQIPAEITKGYVGKPRGLIVALTERIL